MFSRLSTPESRPGASREGLRRSLGRWELAAMGINGVIGSGIFGLPSRAYQLVGTYSLFSFLACALLTALIVLCFAEVASRFRDTGGPYLYAREAFGPAAGFMVAWLLWVSWVAAFAANANLLLDYAAFAWPALARQPLRGAVCIAVTTALTALNIRGVQVAAKTGNWLALAKLASLGTFIAIGLFFVRWDRLALHTPPPAGSFVSSVLLLMWAFAGFEKAVVPAGEAREPRKALPFALPLAAAVVALIYIAVQVVAIGVLPDLAHSTRPLADAATRFLGSAGGAFIAVAAAIAIVGNLNILLLSAARLPFAMAMRGEAPRALAATHARFQTPLAGILLSAVAAALMALTGSFAHAVAISAISRLVAYLATCLALLVFRRRAAGPQAQSLIPAGPAIALAASGLIVILLAGSSAIEARDTAIAILAGLGLYILYGKRSVPANR